MRLKDQESNEKKHSDGDTIPKQMLMKRNRIKEHVYWLKDLRFDDITALISRISWELNGNAFDKVLIKGSARSDITLFENNFQVVHRIPIGI